MGSETTSPMREMDMAIGRTNINKSQAFTFVVLIRILVEVDTQKNDVKDR